MATALDKSLNDLVEAKVKELLDQRVEALVEEKLKKEKESRRKRLAIAVVSKGTIETAYAALILSTTAAALEMEAGIYFSFFGLNILKKGNQDNLKVVPLGNPAMPVNMPNIVSVLPGMTALATMMMKREIKKKKIATVPELMQIAIESGVKLWPCQMAMDMFDLKKEDLIAGLPDPVGAATFLEYASDADITLFI
ncbi:MAG: DsrE/DsrF/DrsH-like family protein [Nitrospirae bacterium]|nr:DsrE/DsrF/DrsH-like family protein [Nitrospirota bacterium]